MKALVTAEMDASGYLEIKAYYAATEGSWDIAKMEAHVSKSGHVLFKSTCHTEQKQRYDACPEVLEQIPVSVLRAQARLCWLFMGVLREINTMEHPLDLKALQGRYDEQVWYLGDVM